MVVSFTNALTGDVIATTTIPEHTIIASVAGMLAKVGLNPFYCQVIKDGEVLCPNAVAAHESLLDDFNNLELQILKISAEVKVQWYIAMCDKNTGKMTAMRFPEDTLPTISIDTKKTPIIFFQDVWDAVSPLVLDEHLKCLIKSDILWYRKMSKRNMDAARFFVDGRWVYQVVFVMDEGSYLNCRFKLNDFDEVSDIDFWQVVQRRLRDEFWV